MKVSELINLLQKQDPDADIHYSYASGDYWRTLLCPTVSRVEVGFIIPTEYHNGFKLIDDQNEDDVRTVVVID
jgi:hypothetical protein